jgi:1-deoxy-D-xylulose-5-phosphate synthase
MRFVKPLDEALLHKVFGKYQKIITIEDGTIVGGLGSAVIEFMAENGYAATIKRLGVPDKFIDQGTQTELARDCGFDMENIRQASRTIVGKPQKTH